MDTALMAEVLPLPNPGDVFVDIRGGDRTMRISLHDDAGVVVVSLWAGRVCRASFQLAVDEVPRLLSALSPVALPEAVTVVEPDGRAGSPAA
jgi:hypothetical protein